MPRRHFYLLTSVGGVGAVCSRRCVFFFQAVVPAMHLVARSSCVGTLCVFKFVNRRIRRGCLTAVSYFFEGGGLPPARGGRPCGGGLASCSRSLSGVFWPVRLHGLEAVCGLQHAPRVCLTYL